MRRREFIAVLGGTAVSWPIRARAQTPVKVYRIGLLNSGGLGAGPFEAPLLRGLARLGYTPDKNLALERRGAEGHLDRLPQLVADLALGVPFQRCMSPKLAQCE